MSSSAEKLELKGITKIQTTVYFFPEETCKTVFIIFDRRNEKERNCISETFDMIFLHTSVSNTQHSITILRIFFHHLL
jgi:hypothetical protein